MCGKSHFRNFFFMPPTHRILYIVRCSDGSLYTDVTDNIEAAILELNRGKGSPYTRSRLPVFLAYTEEYMNEIDARKRAAAIKRMSRSEKEHLLVAAHFGAAAESAYGT